jgi:hypothetical protein
VPREFRNGDATAQRLSAQVGLTLTDPSEALAAVHGADVAELGDHTEPGIPTTRSRAEPSSGDGAAPAPVVTIEMGRDDGLVRMFAVRSEGSASAGTLVLRSRSSV